MGPMGPVRVYQLLSPETPGTAARVFRGAHHAMVAAGIGIMLADTVASSRFAWAVSVGGIFDLLGALPGVLDVIFNPGYASLFGFVWVFKLVRYAPGLASLQRVISDARHALFSVLLGFCIVLLFAASLAYLLER